MSICQWCTYTKFLLKCGIKTSQGLFMDVIDYLKKIKNIVDEKYIDR